MRAGALLLATWLGVCACGGPRPAPTLSPQALDGAVEQALAWFAQAQEEDGSFSLHRWNPRHGRSGLPGFGEEDHFLDIAATGLVVLAFAEAGHETVREEGDSCYRRALRWLLTQQIDGGRFGRHEGEVDHYFVTRMKKTSLFSEQGAGYKALTIHMFNHAVPTAALAVAYRASGERALRAPLRRALGHLVHDEHAEYVWTSYYDPYGDMGVVSYVVLAARAAADAGLEKEAAPLLDPALDFLGRVTDPESGRSVMYADPPHCFDGYDSTAINAYCRRILGEPPTTQPLARALGWLAAPTPQWQPASALDGEVDLHDALGPVVNHEYFYHAVRALEGAPGPAAARFADAVVGLLLAHQQKDGALRGSWDPVGVWDRVGGRLYATAMAARTLVARRGAGTR